MAIEELKYLELKNGFIKFARPEPSEDWLLDTSNQWSDHSDFAGILTVGATPILEIKAPQEYETPKILTFVLKNDYILELTFTKYDTYRVQMRYNLKDPTGNNIVNSSITKWYFESWMLGSYVYLCGKIVDGMPFIGVASIGRYYYGSFNTKQVHVFYGYSNTTSEQYKEKIKLAYSNVGSTLNPYTFIPENREDNIEEDVVDGDFNFDSDEILEPTLPNVSITDTGFASIFVPTHQQMHDLFSYMWDSTLFELSGWQKLIADPMDAILSLSVVPCSIPISGSKNIEVGNIPTSVNCNYTTNQFVRVDCGSVFINKPYGSYLDYAPYTSIQLYLPYCSTIQLNTDDFVGKTLSVVYHIDIVTGSCVAYVMSDNNVLYEVSGNCLMQMPIASTDIKNQVNALLTIPSIATTPTGVTAIATSVDAVMGSKPNINRGGGVTSSIGFMGIQKPYVIITRPKIVKPKNLEKMVGFPCITGTTLASCSGYTKVRDIHIVGGRLKDEERKELEQILKGGVVI